jgi:hypothetical protein
MGGGQDVRILPLATRRTSPAVDRRDARLGAGGRTAYCERESPIRNNANRR